MKSKFPVIRTLVECFPSWTDLILLRNIGLTIENIHGIDISLREKYVTILVDFWRIRMMKYSVFKNPQNYAFCLFEIFFMVFQCLRRMIINFISESQYCGDPREMPIFSLNLNHIMMVFSEISKFIYSLYTKWPKIRRKFKIS